MARILNGNRHQALDEAASVLRRGGLVAFPTETVYGLGADAFNHKAVARIFDVKRRPSFDPLIVHLPSAQAIDRVAQFDERVARLAERFWPGPLTIVLPKRPEVPDLVTAGLSTVGVRVPAHPVARAWLEACGVPVAAPSANPFGYVSPTRAEHVAAQLGEAVDIILDGGPASIGLESTIVSLAAVPPRLLRPGAIGEEELQQLLGPLGRAEPGRGRPESPGQLERHYGTRTPLGLAGAPGVLPVAPGERVGLLALKPPAEPELFAAVEVLSPNGDLSTAAARLFAALRTLDAMGLDRLVAEPVPEVGIGVAIMDRLRRACCPPDAFPQQG